MTILPRLYFGLIAMGRMDCVQLVEDVEEEGGWRA